MRKVYLSAKNQIKSTDINPDAHIGAFNGDGVAFMFQQENGDALVRCLYSSADNKVSPSSCFQVHIDKLIQGGWTVFQSDSVDHLMLQLVARDKTPINGVLSVFSSDAVFTAETSKQKEYAWKINADQIGLLTESLDGRVGSSIGFNLETPLSSDSVESHIKDLLEIGADVREFNSMREACAWLGQ